MAGRGIRDLFWIALGLIAASLMLIPQLSIHTATQLIVVGLLSMIAVWLVLRRSVVAAGVFLVALALYGYAVELPGYETPPLLFFAMGGLIGVVNIHYGVSRYHWNPFAATLFGLMSGCALVVLGFMGNAMFREKGMGELALLRYGWSHSWRLMIAMVAGALVACLLANRKKQSA